MSFKKHRLLAVSMGCAASVSFASASHSFTLFTDRTAFEAALGGDLILEDLNDEADNFPAFNTPIPLSGTSLNSVVANSSTFHLESNELHFFDGGNWTITFDFAQDIDAFGLEFFDAFENASSMSFSTNGGDSGTLFTTSGEPDESTQYLGFTTSNGFNSITLTSNTAADGYTADDIAFREVAVPAPASALLILAGIAGLGFSRHIRR